MMIKSDGRKEQESLRKIQETGHILNLVEVQGGDFTYVPSKRIWNDTFSDYIFFLQKA